MVDFMNKVLSAQIKQADAMIEKHKVNIEILTKNASGVAEHPDYSGYKFTNYLIMKNFNNKYPSFGINPEFETKDKIQTLITDICNGKKKCNGEIF